MRSDPSSREPADTLHSAMVRLLRRVATRDATTGLSPARLSALSVLVFGGPMSLASLATAERVTPPTMSRLVQGLERDGLVSRSNDPSDRRAIRISATPAGRKALEEGRRERVRCLAGLLATLKPTERAAVESAAAILLELAERAPES